MFKNHIKIAFRSLGKRKGFALINIIGLTLGIWCSLMIILWVLDEFKQDDFHENGNRICQVLRNETTEDGLIVTGEGTAYPIGDALLEQFPEIENRTRFTGPHTRAINIGEKQIEVKLSAVDPSFFNIFSFPLKEGNKEDCLKDLKSIVISEEMATKNFPQGNAIGSMVNLIVDEMTMAFKVTGVFKTPSKYSSLNFEAVIPIQNYLPYNSTYKSWGNSWMTTYVLLDKHTSLGEVNQKIADLPQKMGGADWFTLFVQPFEDRYLYSKFENGKVAGGRIDYIVLFLIIAAFTLLIACFNFINLTTAWSIKRSKEIGVKKVMGAEKGSLLAQFFLESVILVVVSVALAVVLAKLSVPIFNEIASKELGVDFLNHELYAALGAIAVVTVLFSGLYPAFFMSSFHPINAIQGKLKANIRQGALRKGLVVFQFFLCMLMVAGTIVVYLQLRYVQHKNLGLNQENIMYVPMDINTWKHAATIKEELAKYSHIKAVSTAGGNFIDPMGSTSDPVWEGKSPDAGQMWFAILDVDFDLLEMLDIRLKDGRFFSPEFAADTLNYMVNEEAAKLMAMENPIGKSLSFWGEEGGRIVGEVENFHFRSLHNPIEPMIIRCRPKNTEWIYVKTTPGNEKEIISTLENVHEKFSGLPFNYHFLDETIDRSYSDDRKVEMLGGIFAGLAIFISCLGLFGLAAFTATQRTKEVAIRKVLGASVFGLFRMLSKDFIQLVAIALLIAAPLAWYIMGDWVRGFAFHIAIKWWMFVAAGIPMLLVALITVSYQTVKAARTDPAESLRTE